MKSRLPTQKDEQVESTSIKELRSTSVFGHLHDFRVNRLDLLRRVAETCGDLGTVRVGPLRVVIVSSARMARDILTERHDEFSRVPLRSMDGIKALFGDGMVVADGAKHREQRRRVTSVFSRQRIAAKASIMVEEVERWQASLRNGQDIELVDELDRLTRRISRRALFGMSGTGALDEILEDALTRSARLAMEEVARPLPLPGWVPTRHNVRFRKVIGVLDRTLMELITQRRKQGALGEDALSVLIREADSGLTDRELRDDLMSLFLAGNEASATSLFWCVYHLARDPELAHQLQTEASALVDDADQAQLATASLARDIFRESMRLYPAGYMILRRAKRTVMLGRATISPNALVAINGFMIHRDPRLHVRPDDFMPSRFRSVPDKELSLGYLPFGAGPRTCIGNHFAMLQGPLSLSVINRHLRFTPASTAPPAFSAGFAIAPKGGYHVRVHRVS